LVRGLGLTEEEISRTVSRVLEEIRRRDQVFRQGKPFPDMAGKSVVLVDDGLASGYTMLVAAMFLRKRNAGRITVAVPTGSVDALMLVAPQADLICCLNIRSSLFGFAVADAYEHWYDLDDGEVLRHLQEARKIHQLNPT
jgi:predicted phosphoribosyltransferase